MNIRSDEIAVSLKDQRKITHLTVVMIETWKFLLGVLRLRIANLVRKMRVKCKIP